MINAGIDPIFRLVVVIIVPLLLDNLAMDLLCIIHQLVPENCPNVSFDEPDRILQTEILEILCQG